MNYVTFRQEKLCLVTSNTVGLTNAIYVSKMSDLNLYWAQNSLEPPEHVAEYFISKLYITAYK